MLKNVTKRLNLWRILCFVKLIKFHARLKLAKICIICISIYIYTCYIYIHWSSITIPDWKGTNFMYSCVSCVFPSIFGRQNTTKGFPLKKRHLEFSLFFRLLALLTPASRDQLGNLLRIIFTGKQSRTCFWVIHILWKMVVPFLSCLLFLMSLDKFSNVFSCLSFLSSVLPKSTFDLPILASFWEALKTSQSLKPVGGWMVWMG